MSGSQIYIGMPNGIVLCVDRGSGDEIAGRFYHFYSRDPVLFENADQLIFEMEQFFDSMHFPHPATTIRTFTGNQNNTQTIDRREKLMKDEELLGKHGDLGSFIIRVQQRQNSSMQGRLTWIEKNKTLYFRSVWELIRLMDSAIESEHPSREEELPSWE